VTLALTHEGVRELRDHSVATVRTLLTDTVRGAMFYALEDEFSAVRKEAVGMKITDASFANSRIQLFTN
jgi:hypothetical protein